MNPPRLLPYTLPLALAASLSCPCPAEDVSRHIIEGVRPIAAAPDTTADAFTRALAAGFGEDLTDAYIPGFSGIAFLATVCQNHCQCREYREAAVRLTESIEALGYRVEKVDSAVLFLDEAWARLARSIDRGIPAVVFNLFGDFEDVPLVGYDESADKAWGVRAGGGSEYGEVSLFGWISAQGISGWILTPPGAGDIDRRAFELDRLVEVVASEFRPVLEGG